MKKSSSLLGIIGFAILYAATVFLCAFVGFLHPVCWVGSPCWRHFSVPTLITKWLQELSVSVPGCCWQPFSLAFSSYWER